MVICIHTGTRVAEGQKFVHFEGREGVSRESHFVHFSGLNFANFCDGSSKSNSGNQD